MADKFRSIVFDQSRCLGCTHCMRKCPTQAIRVRDGKAYVNYDRCISCGNCVRACPSHAITTRFDTFDILNGYKYKVALMPSVFYAQFPHINEPELVLNSLHNIGFDYVFEVARAADMLSLLKREMFIMGDVKTPVISTVCPACVELILTKYQCLRDNLIDDLPPLLLSAKMARDEVKKLTGLKDKDIGVFYLSPCPAKVRAIKSGSYSQTGDLNGAIAVSEVVKKLNLVDIKDVVIKDEIKASQMGIAWSTSGGEASNLPNIRQLAADGIDNVVSILRELEDGKLSNIDFVELHACPGGCVGGVFNVINTFVAKSKIHSLRRTVLQNKTNTTDKIDKPISYYKIPWKWQTTDLYTLDKKLPVALQKMAEVEKILKKLPRKDCGICGSPTCRALAEDIVQGNATESMCLVNRYFDENKKTD